MAILIKGTTYTTGSQVTAANLNAHVDSATFDTGAVDGSTTALSGGAIIVRDGGITTAKLAAAIAPTINGGSITGITDLAVTDGGTGASTAGDARTNLGLGTMAVQAAASVAITGGSVKAKFGGTGSAPTIAAGAKLGGGGTVAIAGTDSAGVITITVGAGPTTQGSFADITFASAYAAAPYVILYPANEAGAVNNPYFNVTSTTGGFSFNVGDFTITFVAGKWNYMVIG